jgi:hypothetical protein
MHRRPEADGASLSAGSESLDDMAEVNFGFTVVDAGSGQAIEDARAVSVGLEAPDTSQAGVG